MYVLLPVNLVTPSFFYFISFTFQFLTPATKFGQGYIFTGICHSVNGGGLLLGGLPGPGGCLVQGCLLLGGLLPVGVSAPGGVYSRGAARWRPPPDGHCCGQYAFYWNAFLFLFSN